MSWAAIRCGAWFAGFGTVGKWGATPNPARRGKGAKSSQNPHRPPLGPGVSQIENGPSRSRMSVPAPGPTSFCKRTAQATDSCRGLPREPAVSHWGHRSSSFTPRPTAWLYRALDRALDGEERCSSAPVPVGATRRSSPAHAGSVGWLDWSIACLQRVWQVGSVSPTIFRYRHYRFYFFSREEPRMHGFWLMAGGKEYFLDFDHFPWFRQATLAQLFRAELVHGEHLYWPDLDVDLDLDRIEHPERYPLVAQAESQGQREPGR